MKKTRAELYEALRKQDRSDILVYALAVSKAIKEGREFSRTEWEAEQFPPLGSLQVQ